MERCYYETYLIGDVVESGELSVDKIKEKFMGVANVIDVQIEAVPSLS